MKVRDALAAAMMASLIAGHAAAQESAHVRMTSIMNSVFGAGAWRITGGYRTPEREDALRRQGAMTVRRGGISRHSYGTPDAPGAYDIVVDGMSPFEAADRLRQAGAPFARYMPKGSHGTQGPHLHLEPYSLDLRATGPTEPMLVQANYVRPSRSYASTGGLIVVEGVRRRRGSAQEVEPPEPADPPAKAAPVEGGLAQLRKSAMRDNAQAQLQLGQAYLAGENAPRDHRAALKWMNLAASNPKADARTREEAAAAIEKLAEGLERTQSRSLRIANRDR